MADSLKLIRFLLMTFYGVNTVSPTRHVLFGHSKLTVPNRAAVPVALTRDTIGREYLRVSGETAHGGDRRILVRCRVKGGVGFDVAADGRRVALWSELAAPIVLEDSWEDGKIGIEAIV